MGIAVGIELHDVDRGFLAEMVSNVWLPVYSFVRTHSLTLSEMIEHHVLDKPAS